jgi:hypothetical protein
MIVFFAFQAATFALPFSPFWSASPGGFKRES